MLYFTCDGIDGATLQQLEQVLVIGNDPVARGHVERILNDNGYVTTQGPLDTNDCIGGHLGIIVAIAQQGSVHDAACIEHVTNECRTSDSPLLVIAGANYDSTCLLGRDGICDLLRAPFASGDLLIRTQLLLSLRSRIREVGRLENQLQAAQRLECVGALAAGVTHEFNNLMCAVMGFAEMARDSGGTDIEALRECAEISYQTAQRAAATASNLLSFSRHAKTERMPGDLNDAISAAIKLSRSTVAQHGVQVAFKKSQLPVCFFAFGPMQQVFMNLILNGCQAMEKAASRELLVKATEDGESRIIISISDSGYGISPDNMESIFTPFFSTKTQCTAERKGSGLGLSIVDQVVRDHGGTVHVASEVGRGTTFTIRLPVGAPDQNQNDASSIVPESDAAKNRVLVVDDEEGSRRVQERLLSMRGHRVFAASSMSEAFALILSQNPELIVLDMIMPDSRGPENIRNIRSRGIETPILICTGQIDGDLIEQGLKAGANGVVTKPFSASEFFSAMEACMLKRAIA
jgi:two-component system, cell cycle sensor histidine kinase and response regulator CckA